MLTPFQAHVQKWSRCRQCHLCQTRTRVVLWRGRIPCDVLFVGEGPGRSEDVRGIPFDGPAGILLDAIVEKALRQWPEVRCGFTNLLACIPVDDDGAKTGKPLPEDVRACSGRLKEVVKLAEPRLIVCVGAEASHWLDAENKAPKGVIKFHRVIPLVAVDHPSFILQSKDAQQGLLVNKATVLLRKAAERVI